MIILFQLHPISCSPDLERLLYSSNAEIFDLLVFTEIRNQDLHQFLTFVLRYVDKSFNNQFKPTINADFLTKELQIEGKLVALQVSFLSKLKFLFHFTDFLLNNLLLLQIWDTPGREKFHNLAVPYYRGADGCILVYDINSKKSFEALDKWYSLFMEQVSVERTLFQKLLMQMWSRSVCESVSGNSAILICIFFLNWEPHPAFIY